MQFCSKQCYTKSLKGIYPKNLNGKRGVKPRTYYKRTNRFGGIEAIEWRTSIFKRDKYTCQKCGQIGGRLNAHHIKPFELHTSSRFDINNGVTLCLECHKKTDSFGWQNYWKNHIAEQRIKNTQTSML